MSALARIGRLGAPLIAGLALAIAPACGGASPRTEQRATPTDPHRVRAPGDPAPRYETRSSPGPVVGEVEAGVFEEAIRSAAPAHDGTSVEGDGRLALFAAWCAERLGEGGTPPPFEVLELFARHLGLVEPVPLVLVVGQPDRAMLASAVRDALRPVLARQRFDRWGATTRDRGGLLLAVLALSYRPVDLEPFARRVEPGESIRLRGRLRDGLVRPALVLESPDGSVERVELGAGPDFDHSVRLETSGMHRIELLAEGPHGITVAAIAAVAVGVPIPVEVRLDEPQETPTDDPAVIAARLLDLAQRVRRASGVGPLELDERLSAVARNHSQDMVTHGYVGHVSPRTGDALQRLQAAGLRSSLVLENVGRGASATEIHRALLSSPGHRANLLNPDVTHVGIGVVVDRSAGRTAFVATQLFARMGRTVDLAAAAERLLERINQARQARGAPPLRVHERLREAAQRAADAFFDEPSRSQQDLVDEASGSLRRFGIEFRRVGGLMTVVVDPEEAATLEPALERDMRWIGLGLRQGTRPDTPPNAIAVVMLFGWSR